MIQLSFFADDVKMVFPQFKSSHRLSSISSAWTWTEEWDLPINSNKCSCLTVGNLPPLSLSFPSHSIPPATCVSDPGVPLDTTFTSSVQCEYGKTVAIHEPPVFHGIIKDYAYPIVRFHHTATLKLRNGWKIPEPQS